MHTEEERSIYGDVVVPAARSILVLASLRLQPYRKKEILTPIETVI
jgi:hypothetical protein